MVKKKTSSSIDENIALEINNQDDFNKQLEEIDGEEEVKCGTIYIGHIPHGFYENEMKGYFTQFGTVKKIRLARSKKTGGYKGYGYIQFANEDVAKIAADAMNNYLMFDKLLRCQFIADKDLHPAVWKGHNKKFIWVNRSLKQKKQHNSERTEEQLRKTADRLIKRDNKKRKQLGSLGISYEFPGYEAAIKKASKKKVPKAKTPKAKNSKNYKEIKKGIMYFDYMFNKH